MLKTIFVSVFLFFASILLVANAAWSSPLQHGIIVAQTSVTPVPSSESATPQVSKSSQTTSTKSPKDNKAEAFKDQNKKTSTSSRSQNTETESGGPYDMESIKAFNRALYGS